MNTQETYGSCRLSVVNVRVKPLDGAEVTTQLLFGDIYRVIKYTEDQKWAHIQLYQDEMTGWIDYKQHHYISQAYFEYLQTVEYRISLEISAYLLINRRSIPIVLGSIVPITDQQLFPEEQPVAFTGESKRVHQRRDHEFLIEVSKRYLGAPYMWGGKSPFGIDCSGFTQMVYKICGYNIKRDSWQQAMMGTEVNWAERFTGDLAFFSNTQGKIIHVGIMLPDSKIIHASGEVRVDECTEKGIVHHQTKTLTHILSHIKRIIT